MNCLLCKSAATKEYANCDGIHFLQCKECLLVFKDPRHFPSSASEKERYLLHENDVNDVNFQQYVSPIVNCILKEQTSNHSGLDYGAGPGPVIAKLLSDKGYNVALYDPFFYPDKAVLESSYDFIICCEVIEHFHFPYAEFLLLRKLLKPHGSLYCKTGLLPKRTEFEAWWYKNDSTHVVFYSEKNLRWIKENFGFSEVIIHEDMIVFEG